MTNEVLETMREALEEEPDAAILLTLNDLDAMADGDRPEPGFSLYAGFSDDPEEFSFERRYAAQIAAKFLGKHFPNEAKAGVHKAAGGSVTFSDSFVDPEIELKRRQPEEATDD